ncbi:hypothetical protein [Streptomyces sp. NPDC058964]
MSSPHDVRRVLRRARLRAVGAVAARIMRDAPVPAPRATARLTPFAGRP